MNQADYQASTPYARFGSYAIDAPVDARRAFIRQTYIHLAAAVYALVALEWLFFTLDLDAVALNLLIGVPYSWLIVIGAFMAVSFIANRWALSGTSPGLQYAGLTLYVVAQALILLPLLAIAQMKTVDTRWFGEVGVIPAATVTTLAIFGVLTGFVFITRKDFSFLGSFLAVVMISAVVLIGASIFLGFNLGIWFVWAMILAACAYILYDTSNVLHHYRTDQYVAAALALFASVALLFW